MASSTAILLLVLALKVSAVCLSLLVARGLVWLLNMMLVMPRSDPLQNLPGPDGPPMESHLRRVMDPCLSPQTHEGWQKKFGKTFRFHGFGRHDYRLMSFDFRVLTHVMNSPIYEKPWQARTILSRLIGRGIFSMEGTEHRIQRRLIGPAFTSQSLKSMTPIFFQKAQTLCDRWGDLVAASPNDVGDGSSDLPPAYTSTPTTSHNSKSVIVDIARWISRASFDVIGLVGFDYRFNALEDESEKVYGAYRRMFDVADKGPELRGILELYFPIIRRLWPNNGTKVTNESRRIIKEAGKRLVADKKCAIMADASVNQHNDILSFLIKANLSSDPSKRLSDSELLDQCSTFLLAGSDSVSLALSWCLYYLARNPEIQTRLRNEILGLISTSAHCAPSFGSADEKTRLGLDDEYLFPPPPSPPSSPPPRYRSTDYALHEHWNEIESLPYLDAVVRETLRICPPVHSTIRVATADDLIPISHPIVLRDGTMAEKDSGIKIRKGSYIHIPVEGFNLSAEIWGGDALTFDPDRWTSLVQSPVLPGLGNVMTFGLGPHSCLGYKFTLKEMKAFLATILPQFTFAPAEGMEITKFNSILTRPYIKDKWDLGTQLPVVISAYCTL